jgi:septum site-determining protein MinD
MPKTIGIIAIKGGVGKTTIAASLASDLVNHFGKKVLLVDANYSAPNLGLHMDIVEPNKTIHDVLANKAKIKNTIHNRFGVDVIPGSYVSKHNINPLKLRDKLKKIKNNYDFIIIDSSPTLNEEVLSSILASDSLFVVSTPDYPTMSCSLKAAKLAKLRGRPISGIILNKIRNPKFEISMDEIEKATEIPVVAKIPDDATNIKALFTRIPTSIFYKKSKFSKEINNLSTALTNNIEKRSIIAKLLPNLKKEQVNRQLLKQKFYKSRFK